MTGESNNALGIPIKLYLESRHFCSTILEGALIYIDTKKPAVFFFNGFFPGAEILRKMRPELEIFLTTESNGWFIGKSWKIGGVSASVFVKLYYPKNHGISKLMVWRSKKNPASYRVKPLHRRVQ